jgi:hypothetical protein
MKRIEEDLRGEWMEKKVSKEKKEREKGKEKEIKEK